MTRSISFLLVLLAVAKPVTAAAQRVEDLSRGEKVRVVLRGGATRLAYMDTVTADTIRLHVFDKNPDGASLAFNREMVTAMQVYEKKAGKGVARGAFFGLIIGAGTGFLVGALTYSDSNCDVLACSPSSAGAFASVWGGVIGIPAGMMWGASRHEWRDVAMRRQ